MLGSPAGPGGPSQRGGLWPLAPTPAPTATSFTTPDGFNKYGVYSLFPGGPSLGSAIYSHSSTIAGRFTSGSLQPQTGGPFHTAHKISDSLFSTGYTFGAPTPPPGSPYSPVSVAQLEFLTKGFNSSNVITIQQPQQQQHQHHQQQQSDTHLQATTSSILTTPTSTIPDQTVKKLQKFDTEHDVDDGKCCSDCFKQYKYCNCNTTLSMSSMSIDKNCTKLSNINKNTATLLQTVSSNNPGTILTGISGGCSRTNPLDWSSVNIKKEPGTTTNTISNVSNSTNMVPCQVAEITTSMSPMVKVEITSPTIQQKETNNLATPIVTTNGNIPVGIAVARQRIQHQEVVAASPSLPPAGLLTTVNTSTQIKEISRISELDHAGMAATSATGGGIHGGVHGGGTLLQCADDRPSGLGNWPMCGTHNSALTTPTLWQYPAHLPVEPVVPVPVPPVGLQLVREPTTGHLLLLNTTGLEQAVVWPSYAQASPHVLFPPMPPPPLQLLSSSSSDYLATSTTLHQHTQTHHHSTRLVALTTDSKRKIPLPIPATTTTLIKIETDPTNLDHSHHHHHHHHHHAHPHQQQNKTLQSVVGNGPVFTEQTTPLLTTHVIYQHPTNLILSSSPAQTNENQSTTVTSCRSQGTSPVTCLTPPPETLLSIADEEPTHITTLAVQDASNQTETPSCSGSEDDDIDKKQKCDNFNDKKQDYVNEKKLNEINNDKNLTSDINDKKQNSEVKSVPQETVIETITTKTKRNGSLEEAVTVFGQKEIIESICPDLSGLELLSNTIVVHEKNHVIGNETIDDNVLDEEDEIINNETKCDRIEKETVTVDDSVMKEQNYNLVGLDLLCALAEQRIREEGRDTNKSAPLRNKRKLLVDCNNKVERKKLKFENESTTSKLSDVQIKEETKTKASDEEMFQRVKKIKLESSNRRQSDFQMNGNRSYREESRDETGNDDETESKSTVNIPQNSRTSPNRKCRWKEENYRTYKTPESELEVRKYLASKSQTIYMQNDDFYYWPPCNSFEIEMRKQLADLQKKYKEKQKELNKLKPKSKQKNRISSRNGEKKMCEKLLNSSPRSSTVTPPPPVLDKIEDLPPSKFCNNKISHELLLKPPTLLRINTNEKTLKESEKRGDKFEIKKIDKLITKRECSSVCKKEEKHSHKKQHEKCERRERIRDRSMSKEKELEKSSDQQKEKLLEKKQFEKNRLTDVDESNRDKHYDKDTSTSQIETSSSQKRKVGRPKKLISKQGLTIGTETIVAKKPKKNTLVGYLLAAKEQFLQERLYSTAATNSPPRYPEESIKIHRAVKHSLKRKDHDKNKDKCKIRPKLKAEPTIKTYTEEEEEDEDDDEEKEEEDVEEPDEEVEEFRLDEEEPVPDKEDNCKDLSLATNICSKPNDIYEEVEEEAEAEEIPEEESIPEALPPRDVEKTKKKAKNAEKKKTRRKQRDKDVKCAIQEVEETTLLIEDDNKVVTTENDTKEKFESETVKDDEELSAESYKDKLPVKQETKEEPDNRCTLTNEHLGIDKLRVLTAMGGLFYAGHLNAVEPPDVYSITLDGERGNRPHIMSREEILRDAIVEVSPTSTEELTPGTRLCAYWSQQYRCLYPGSVAEPGTPDPLLDSKFVSVEFDDGDSGRIALEDIRLLPTDYPIIEYDPNPLLSLSKRKRRTSATISTEERRTYQQQQQHQQQQQEKSSQNKIKIKDDVMEKENKDINKQEILLLGNNVSSSTSNQLLMHQQQHREKKRLKKRKRDKEKILKGVEENNKKRKRKHKCNGNDELCKHKRHHKKHKKHKKHHHQHEKNESLDDDNKDTDNNGNKKKINPNVTSVTEKERKKKNVEVEVIKEAEIINEEPIEEETINEEDVTTAAAGVEEEAEEEPTQAAVEEEEEEEDDDNEEFAKNEVTLDDILEAKSKKSKKIRDRQESCESRSKMSAFLPARQLWGWSGKGYKRPRVKGRMRKLFYKAIQRGKETIMLGDSAVFLSTGRPDRPYIGRIEAMWEACGTMVVKVKWFYHPEETIGCPLNLQYPGALFESPHVDENDVQTISHKCEVLPLDEYKEKLGDDPQRYAAIYDNNDIYYLAGYYDPTSTTLKFQDGIPFTNTTTQ